MKKIMTLVGILMMVILVGCGKEEVQTKKLYIGTNAEYKPYEYIENGEITGFDIEFMEELAKNLGYEIEWKNLSFDGLLPALQTKKIDMVIAGMTPTEERKKAIDFTDIYYSSAQAILVNEDTTGIKNLDDLKGKKVGVQLGTIQETIANEIEGVELKRYNSFTGAILELNSKKIDAVIVGEVVANNYLENNKKLKLAGLLDERQDGSAIALGKGNPKLISELNEEIKKMKKSGKYQELINKYFGG
ncbi:MAG: basic amino acid ABC transporter substrate-binding protein [Psychrilyobacter sp.]|uniref:basic amino acid ABC transporter substrate-binding protein n=1 Tax=Psychrilyobacter sp. TaxID=2586924 RepID=UPI003C751D5D